MLSPNSSWFNGAGFSMEKNEILGDNEVLIGLKKPSAL
jgi:hypothetical protein